MSARNSSIGTCQTCQPGARSLDDAFPLLSSLAARRAEPRRRSARSVQIGTAILTLVSRTEQVSDMRYSSMLIPRGAN
jgi:hypothetical protein